MVYPDWCLLHCKGYQETHRCFIDDCTKPQTREHTPEEPIFEPYIDLNGNKHIDARHKDFTNSLHNSLLKVPKLIIHHTDIFSASKSRDNHEI